MAMLLKVNWVDLSDQDDPYQRVKNIGGTSRKLEWQHTRDQAIRFLDQDEFCYYMEDNGRVLKLKVGLDPNGAKFLKTDADADQPQLLLSLQQNVPPGTSQGLRQ